MARQKLSEIEAQLAINELKHWRLENGSLVRDLEFADFVAAMKYVNEIAAIAEHANHHPDIDIRYNKVRLSLVTHDVGGITANDTTMAKKLDEDLPEQE
jgi:4a-hydroxytetrahydrobiopterin dehydratase